MAIEASEVIRPAVAAHDPRRHPVLAAAALFGLAEVALQRVAAPVSTHLTLPSVGRDLSEGARVLGDFAAGATAALIIVASAVLAWSWMRRQPVLGAGLAAALGAAVLALAAPAPPTRLLLGAVVVAAVAAIAWTAPAVGMAKGALLAAAVAIWAGHWSLVAGEAGALGGAAATVTGVPGVRALGEAALAVAAVLAAAAVWRRHPPNRAALLAGATAAAVAGAALLLHLDRAAMATIWALGITLSLPAILYMAAAAAAGMVAVTWWRDPARRPLLAGVALLVVAGLQPATLNHSLTAVLAISVLAVPTREVS